MSEASNGSNLPLRPGLRGIMNLRARRGAELAYIRRQKELQKQEREGYTDPSELTPNELEQKRQDRLHRKLYRMLEDPSQLTSAQHAARIQEIARNEVDEVYESPEALELDVRTSEGRRRLRQLVEEARLRRISAAKDAKEAAMNTGNNAINAPLQVESIATDGKSPERARWLREAGQRAMQAAKREVNTAYESPEGLSAQERGNRPRLHELVAEARLRRLATDKPQMTSAEIAEAARKELGGRRWRFPKLFGGSTKRRKMHGKKSRGTYRRPRS